MIRGALVLIALALAAAGIGWLGEVGWPPLVVVHEGEQIRVVGPGPRDVTHREPGRIAWRIPILSRAYIVDTRLRQDLILGLDIGRQGDRVDIELWWKVEDATRYLDIATESGAADPFLADLEEPFRQTLANWAFDQTLGQNADVLAAQLLGTARDAATARGVKVLDVRIAGREGAGLQRAMRAQREEVRDALERERMEIGPRLRAEAEGEAARIESAAARDAEIARGRTDADVARIYAEAHQMAPEFYSFSRQLEAYRKTLGPETTLVLPPDHEFLRLLTPPAANGP